MARRLARRGLPGGRAKAALTERRGHVARDAALPARAYAAYPIEHADSLHGAVVLDVPARTETQLQEVLRALHWGAGASSSFSRTAVSPRRRPRSERARVALDMAAMVGEQPRLQDAALALANELAVRFTCERVAIGIERRGRIRLTALSHAAWFEKKGEFTGTLENAMEEAVDQRRSVAYPALDTQSPPIAVAHRDLAAGTPCAPRCSPRGAAPSARSRACAAPASMRSSSRSSKR